MTSPLTVPSQDKIRSTNLAIAQVGPNSTAVVPRTPVKVNKSCRGRHGLAISDCFPHQLFLNTLLPLKNKQLQLRFIDFIIPLRELNLK